MELTEFRKISLWRIIPVCLIFISVTTNGEKIDLYGTVISAYGNPVPGLVLVLDNARIRDTTDSKGRFHFFGDSNTSVTISRDIKASGSTETDHFIILDNKDNIPLVQKKGGEKSREAIYNLAGRAITWNGIRNRFQKNIVPGIYLEKKSLDITHSLSNQALAATSASLDNLSITYNGFDAQEHFSYEARIVNGGVIAPTSTRPW